MLNPVFIQSQLHTLIFINVEKYNPDGNFLDEDLAARDTSTVFRGGYFIAKVFGF